MDWIILLLTGILLMVTWWPVGAWHLWSWMWLTIILTVLIFEAIAYWFSPEKKTISNQMRDYRKKHPILFWMNLTVWMAFAWFLSIHLVGK